jgi:hypothetical protein
VQVFLVMFPRYRALAAIAAAGASGSFKINSFAYAEEAQTQTAEPQSWTQHNATLPYWHNKATRESTWVQPTGVSGAIQVAEERPAAVAAKAEAGPSKEDSAPGGGASTSSAVFGSASSGAKWDKNWDLGETVEADEIPTEAVHHIVLIRHGQYCKGTGTLNHMNCDSGA